MKLSDIASILDADMVIHVVTVDDSLYFGTVRAMYILFDDSAFSNAHVSYVFNGFGGLCIEVAL